MLTKKRPLRQSFQDAFSGICYALRTQRNMRIHAGMTLLVLGLSAVLAVPVLEMLFLLSAVVFVVVTEMINTGIETTVDLTTSEYHDKARNAKNVAAGAVLTASLYALVVGYLILGRRLFAWFSGG